MIKYTFNADLEGAIELQERENLNIRGLVLDLIATRREGGYWDFKREWYNNDTKGKQNMLHDIICMANNIDGKDAYIIIGVDESDDFAFVGVDANQTRRNTQNMVDFIRDKKFAGNFRPTVSVATFEYSGKEIDVIIVYSDNNTPYYLSEKFQGVHANNIYMRIQDSNTPIDRSADIHNIEKLWRKRFGIDKTALERLEILLSDCNNWEYKEQRPHYHKLHPEFYIEYPEHDEDEQYETSRQIYSGFYINKSSYWYNYKIYYHSVLLHDSAYHVYDGSRIMLASHTTKMFRLDDDYDNDTYYYYFNRDSIEGKMLLLFTKGNDAYDERCDYCKRHDSYCSNCSIFGSMGGGAFLIFKNEDSRKSFETYVLRNMQMFDEIEVSDELSAVRYAVENNWNRVRAKNMIKLHKMLNLWEQVTHNEAEV